MASTIKPNKINPNFLKDIENKYGPVNMDYDFFSSDLSTYYKALNPENPSSIEHKIINLTNFTDSFKTFVNLISSLKKLIQSEVGDKDLALSQIYKNTKNVFNSYRTHIRKNYPNQYEDLKNISLNEYSTTGGGSSFSSGTGEQYATSKAFKKIKKSLKEASIYKYRLGKTENKAKEFHQERIAGFDTIKDLIVQLGPLLDQAKEETKNYYIKKPKSFEVVKPTDLIIDYLKDVINLLKE